MSLLNIWLLTLRPKVLPASISPVCLGSALAFYHGMFDGSILILLLLLAILIQTFTNLVNDYYDFINCVDVQDRKGPKRGLQLQKISLTEMRIAIFLVLLLCFFRKLASLSNGCKHSVRWHCIVTFCISLYCTDFSIRV